MFVKNVVICRAYRGIEFFLEFCSGQTAMRITGFLSYIFFFTGYNGNSSSSGDGYFGGSNESSRVCSLHIIFLLGLLLLIYGIFYKQQIYQFHLSDSGADIRDFCFLYSFCLFSFRVQ